jgi:hypothetical protein
MNIKLISRRFLAVTAFAALFAATALTSMPVQADTIPAAKEHAEPKAGPATPAPVEKTRTSGLTRGEVNAQPQRSRASREVEPGAFAGPFFGRSTVRRSVGE